MPGKIRVMVVDDAVVIRRMVSDILNEDPEIEVVGVAPNGRLAVQKVPQINPDVMILDVEMPDLDGIQTVKQLRREGQKLPIIMFSTMTERGATSTLDALAAGATDYVTKPTNVGSALGAVQKVKDELIPKIKAHAERKVLRLAKPVAAASPQVKSTVAKHQLPTDIGIVAIGVSTGGPNALAEVIPALPADFPVPVVITQHMPPLFTKYLAERLNARSPNEVVEAKEGMAVQPGRVIIAPGDYHMDVVRETGHLVVRLHQSPPENSCRPAVDVMFRSVVKAFGGKVLGVILTGMGNDGLRGSEAVKSAGGVVIAQDEASSVVWGMPGSVVKAGLADEVMPLSAVSLGIVRRVTAAGSLSRGADDIAVGRS